VEKDAKANYWFKFCLPVLRETLTEAIEFNLAKHFFFFFVSRIVGEGERGKTGEEEGALSLFFLSF
jgi:hypothetical protein